MSMINVAFALGIILILLAGVAIYNSWGSTYADFTTGLIYRALSILFMVVGVIAVAYSRVLKSRVEELSQF